MKRIVNSLIVILIALQLGSSMNPVLHDLEAANSQKMENIINITEERDPFVGQYKGQLFGMYCIWITYRISNNKYSIYVNGIGPDEAFLKRNFVRQFKWYPI